MELKIYWTDFAKNELKNIFEYYKDNAGLKIARNITGGIAESTLKLSSQPCIGAKEPLLEDRKQEFRYLFTKTTKLFTGTTKKRNELIFLMCLTQDKTQ